MGSGYSGAMIALWILDLTLSIYTLELAQR
jgi:hypothetical protein